MKICYSLLAKYPERKTVDYEGDGHILYETGNRTMTYPTLKEDPVKDLVEETEGEDTESSVVFHTNLSLLERDGNTYPVEDNAEGSSFYDKVRSTYGELRFFEKN